MASAAAGGPGDEHQLLEDTENNILKSDGEEELKRFRSWIRWMFVEQSDPWHTFLSWVVFLILVVGVPVLSLFVLSCPSCNRRPYDMVVELSLSAIATLSFFCLSNFVNEYGLDKFLFLDKLCNESDKVRGAYTDQLNRAFKVLSYFILPSFIAEIMYKIWWYCIDGSRIPFFGNMYVSDTISCILELCSWLYRTSIFFLVCMLFCLICYLQILRLEDFTLVFQDESDAVLVLKRHLRIRRQLRVISHRFRAFIVYTLMLVTASQLGALLVTTRSNAKVNLFKAGELALCSIGLVAGLFMCLRSATKITHKAQAITSHAAKWHLCATVNSFETSDSERSIQITYAQLFPDIDSEDETIDGDDLEDAKFAPLQAHTISFQKRAALVTYFENNQAGITVYGFMLDRTWLYAILVIELTLVLWLLGETTGIS